MAPWRLVRVQPAGDREAAAIEFRSRVTVAVSPATALEPVLRVVLMLSCFWTRVLPLLLATGGTTTDAAAMLGVATTTVTAEADHAAPRSAVRRLMPEDGRD
jgi:hypothetical protein